ncbi:MAG: YfhO family protein, partial [Oscillospiraceae bacterium]|nr:YfhO family protein [Oscillospiraceae bacterium]
IFTGDTRSIEYSENWRQYIDNMYVALTGVEILDEKGNRDYEKLEVVSRAINQNAVKMIKQQGNTIKFSAKGKYALATIMYDDCWHIKVNGKKVAPQKFMTWFTAVPLEEGENIVEMTYIPRGFVPGLCLMAAGALLLIAGVLLKDRFFNKEGRLC